MISEKIKQLRLSTNKTQSDIAKALGITRSSVNAWEMGISIPSTSYIIELSKLFDVSTDCLLGLDKNSTINVDGLSDDEIAAVVKIVSCLKHKEKTDA